MSNTYRQIIADMAAKPTGMEDLSLLVIGVTERIKSAKTKEEKEECKNIIQYLRHGFTEASLEKSKQCEQLKHLNSMLEDSIVEMEVTNG